MSGMGPSLLLSHKDIFMKIRTGVYFKIYQVRNNKSHFITESHNKQLYKTCGSQNISLTLKVFIEDKFFSTHTDGLTVI